MPHKTKASTEDIIDLYNQGYSCEKIANIYNMSRQAVHERLKRNKVEMRTKKVLPYIMYDGIKFTRSSTTCYYRSTQRDKHITLHRYKYEKEKGSIPIDWDVHHKDFNKLNNDISNLEAMPREEHSRLHMLERNKSKNIDKNTKV